MGYLEKNSKKWIYNDGDDNGIIVSGTTLKKEEGGSIVADNLDISNGTTFNDETIKALQNNIYKPNVVSALSGDVIDLDCDGKNFFDIYLDRPVTRFNMPTNVVNGETYRVQIRQDGVGGRFIKWGNKDVFDDLDVSLYQGGGELEIYIDNGTFDWSVLRADPGRKSFINLKNFNYENNNISGLKVKSFNESANLITCYSPNWFIDDEENGDGAIIEVENAFYFTDEKGEDWIGQFPYGVTMFQFYSTNDGNSAMLEKIGVYSNSLFPTAKTRFEERLTDDFVNGSDDGLLNWRESNSNGSTSTFSSDVDSEHPGILIQRLNGGATANGRTSTSMGTDMFNISNKRIIIEGVVKPNGNAFSTADVNYYFGWSDNVQFQSMNDGVVFKIITDGTGKGRVHCITEKAGTVTDYDTGIDFLEDEWHSLKIGLPPNGLGIHFIVDNYLVHTADRTTFGENVKVTCGFAQFYAYTGTPLPNSKDWFIDVFSLRYRMNKDRI